ncbi:MAG TPA: Ohr family peroxiredoxin [Thermoleophilaceae bacterium]|nr:Ohr family peroxiredoxin [Thermoleophilaceae bacterium]
MTEPVYTAEARVTGGRARGHGQTASGSLDLQLRPPGEASGEPVATNPEELFAIGYAACFEGALSAAARRASANADDASIASRVMLFAADGGGFYLGVALDVTLPSVNGDAAVELVRAAHGMCPYSKAVRGNIDVTLTANGQAVE